MQNVIYFTPKISLNVHIEVEEHIKGCQVLCTSPFYEKLKIYRVYPQDSDLNGLAQVFAACRFSWFQVAAAWWTMVAHLGGPCSWSSRSWNTGQVSSTASHRILSRSYHVHVKLWLPQVFPSCLTSELQWMWCLEIKAICRIELRSRDDRRKHFRLSGWSSVKALLSGLSLHWKYQKHSTLLVLYWTLQHTLRTKTSRDSAKHSLIWKGVHI